MKEIKMQSILNLSKRRQKKRKKGNNKWGKQQTNGKMIDLNLAK